MFDRNSFNADCKAIRLTTPLVLNIINYVAMTPAANALLAIGASPLMSFCPDEMLDLVQAANSVSINIGCLNSELVKASRIAAATATELGKPWVLDPVGVGASALRNKVAADLALNYRPRAIKGNASEIISLANCLGADISIHRPKGVDATADTAEAVSSAQFLSGATDAVVCVSGAVDYIVYNDNIEEITSGDIIMSRVTAMGCTATAVCAAFLAVNNDTFRAVHHSMTLMGEAGEIAARDCSGTGSFAVRFLDTLSEYEAL